MRGKADLRSEANSNLERHIAEQVKPFFGNLEVGPLGRWQQCHRGRSGSYRFSGSAPG